MRLAIVAHSMGGLAARYALEATEQPLVAVTHLFLLGTPNRGSALAEAQSVIELLLSIPQGKLLGSELMRDGLGEAAKDLQPGSVFLSRLNVRKPAVGVRYYVAIGQRSFLSQERVAAIKSESASFLRRRGTAQEVQRAVVEFLSSDELRDGLGDGAVTVASAAVPAAMATRVFDLNHVQLLSLPGNTPEESELFRWVLESLGWQVTEP
jgi:pimeloyl-ACP methyl ester carboxylesterase